MTSLRAYATKTEFTNSLPEGRTYFDLDQTECFEELYSDEKGNRVIYKAKNQTGKTFSIPKTVMQQIKKYSMDPLCKRVCVLRSGMGLKDTRYIVENPDVGSQ